MKIPIRNTKKPTEAKMIIHLRNNSSGVLGFRTAPQPGKKGSDEAGAFVGGFAGDWGVSGWVAVDGCFRRYLEKINPQEGHTNASSGDSRPQFGHFMGGFYQTKTREVGVRADPP